jgi:4-hydroxy-tetrahydrodipicolinate synthase
MKLEGTLTALITPFYQGKIDLESFRNLIRYQLDHGVQGFVINGTTAESPTLLPEERTVLLQEARKMVGSQVTLLMGVGTNSTAETSAQAYRAEKLGADGVLVVVPYYNKPPQRGLIAHFNEVSRACSIPVVLYNVPGRTVISMDFETIVTLAENPRIVGIKEASGNIELAGKIREATSLALLSGDDESYEDFLRVGGQGIISVASHVLPREFVNKKIKEHLPLIRSLYIEANPIPVKMALSLMGLIRSPECRLPLVSALPSTREILEEKLTSLGLLESKGLQREIKQRN